MSNGLLVDCMLDSGAMHSFVHAYAVYSTEAQLSQCAVLTVTVANGSNGVHTLDLMFTEGGDIQVTNYWQLYVIAGL